MPNPENIIIDETALKKINSLNETINTSKRVFSDVVDRYGRNGKLSNELMEDNKKQYDDAAVEQYNAITLPEVEGMDDDMIAFVAMGTIMDKKYIGKILTSSSTSGKDPYTFNKTYVADNIIKKDSRTMPFSDVLPKARYETKMILDAYNNGDKERVKKAIGNIAEYIKDDLGGQSYSDLSGGGIYLKGFYKTILKFMDDPDLGVKDMFSPRDLARIKGNAKKLEAFEKANKTAKDMIENYAEPGSAEREKQVIEYLSNMTVANVNALDIISKEETFADLASSVDDFAGLDSDIISDPENVSQSGTEYVDNLLNHLQGKDFKKMPLDIQLAYGRVAANSEGEARTKYRDHNITHSEVILAEDNGEEKLLEHYKEQMKDSPLYKQLLNAKDPASVVKAINQTDLRFRVTGAETLPHSEIYSEKTAELSEGKTAEFNAIKDSYRKDVRLLSSGIVSKKELAGITKGLNTQPGSANIFQRNHKDSQSIIDLREKTEAFENSLRGVGEPAMADPNVRKALLEAYKASVKYQNEKMTQAGADMYDNKWEPRLPMGKERFRAARRIEELAKEFIMDDIMALEKQAEYDLNSTSKYVDRAKEAKRVSSQKFSDKSYEGKAYNEAVNDLKTQHDEGSFDLSGAIAKVMAVKMVADIYKTHKMVLNHKTVKEFNQMVKHTAADLQNRDDFKYMIKKNSRRDLYNAAMEDGGKRLLPKLASARKALEPKAKPITTEQPKPQAQLGGKKL
ncbi:hypothetical protein [Ruminococcus sp. NK3A76]|uniref:hypothetical protein n=1 Tax=Ruminococcus sp. NK3A76 TaxID=877411 RepID=UPI000491890B|nr:hypothetical protein [Ruminococcus sp. NK3A76]